jgi:hypothetical protein
MNRYQLAAACIDALRGSLGIWLRFRLVENSPEPGITYVLDAACPRSGERWTVRGPSLVEVTCVLAEQLGFDLHAEGVPSTSELDASVASPDERDG